MSLDSLPLLSLHQLTNLLYQLINMTTYMPQPTHPNYLFERLSSQVIQLGHFNPTRKMTVLLQETGLPLTTCEVVLDRSVSESARARYQKMGVSLSQQPPPGTSS